MCTTHAQTINADLFAFIRGEQAAVTQDNEATVIIDATTRAKSSTLPHLALGSTPAEFVRKWLAIRREFE